MTSTTNNVSLAASRFALPAILLVAGACIESSAAVTLFDNLSAGSPNGYSGVGNTQWVGQAFSTAETDFVVNEVSLRLWNNSGTTGSFEIQIWDASGASSQPGEQVGMTIYTGLAQELGSSPGVLSITGLNVSLDSNTTYYLMALGTGLTDIPGFDIFEPSSPGSLAWNVTNVNQADFYTTGNSGSDWYGPFPYNAYMSISGEAVPEVSSATLSALAIGTIMFRRRRC